MIINSLKVNAMRFFKSSRRLNSFDIYNPIFLFYIVSFIVLIILDAH